MRWMCAAIGVLLGCVTGFAAPATTTTTAPADPVTPRGALKLFAKALDDGDRAGVRAMLQAENAHEEKLAAATAELAEATAVLRKAASGAFGEEKARPLGVDPAGAAAAQARIDAATERIEGDSATLRTPDSEGPPLKLIKRDGKWRVPVAELTKDVEPADLDRNIADMTWQSKQMRDLAAEVSAKKYATATEARQVLDQRILERTLPPLRVTTAPATTKKQE